MNGWQSNPEQAPEIVELVATLTRHVTDLNLPKWADVTIDAWHGRYPNWQAEPATYICIKLKTGDIGGTYEPLILPEEARPHPENCVRTAIRALLRGRFGPGAGQIVADHLIPPTIPEGT